MNTKGKRTCEFPVLHWFPSAFNLFVLKVTKRMVINCSWVLGEWKKINGFYLQQNRLYLGITKHFLTAVIAIM